MLFDPSHRPHMRNVTLGHQTEQGADSLVFFTLILFLIISHPIHLNKELLLVEMHQPYQKKAFTHRSIEQGSAKEINISDTIGKSLKMRYFTQFFVFNAERCHRMDEVQGCYL